MTAPAEDLPDDVAVRMRSCRPDDLNQVSDLDHQAFGRNSPPRFVFAQLRDIVGSGFRVVEQHGEIVAYTISVQTGTLLSATAPGPGRINLLAEVEKEIKGAAATSTGIGHPTHHTMLPGKLAPKYEIRRFATSDIDELYQVENQTFVEDPYPRRLLGRLGAVFRDGFLVAERHSRHAAPEIVGSLVSVVDAGCPGVGWIMSLGVLEAHRREGVGTCLMNAAEAYLHEAGCEKIKLTVDPVNKIALHLYQQRNYALVERIDDYHGTGRSRLLMVQDASDAPSHRR
ncbi:GNAT family N-acetyltransferase [Cryptosporangium phraense]|uniref:GNAT family N-acetyltransferase n=1 Tax=Cryptosporangium phraense TaxID=2593070 RepID=UPI0014793E8C|nr:GNAT family N-acetyltransferase [Cryptosporangium phraense]